MLRLKKIFRNIIILGLIILLFSRLGFFLSPMAAHRHSERTIHYGPSEVAHVQDFSGGKYILGSYDKWVSCNTVNRKFFLFWTMGNQPIGFENDESKEVDYSWGMTSDKNDKLYGIINSDEIEKIEIVFENEKTLSITEFYDDLFLITWESEDDERLYHRKIKGYDSKGNIIFEDKNEFFKEY